jgi:hypothetical protein
MAQLKVLAYIIAALFTPINNRVSEKEPMSRERTGKNQAELRFTW